MRQVEQAERPDARHQIPAVQAHDQRQQRGDREPVSLDVGHRAEDAASVLLRSHAHERLVDHHHGGLR